MKRIVFTIVSAVLFTAACVEDSPYEGPPSVDSVVIHPEAPTSQDDVLVTATVSGVQPIKSVTLDYKINGNSTSVVMISVKKGVYTATIFKQDDQTKVDFTITAINVANYKTTEKGEYTVGDKPIDYKMLVINELYGAAAQDKDKFIELYNQGDLPIKLKGVTLKKDQGEEAIWTGADGEIIPAKGHFAIVGAKGSTSRGFSSGFSAKKTVIIELFDPNNHRINHFQRGEKGAAWGATLPSVEGSWSRCPDGTGNWKLTNPTSGTTNPDDGNEDTTVIQ